ncbi:matrixin family metalloprotease [Patescibacteria group bacterium]
MKRKNLFIALVAIFGVLFSVDAAMAKMSFSDYQMSSPGTQKVLRLPEAARHSNVISLGESIDPQSGKIVEGYAIIHRKDEKAKPNWVKDKAPKDVDSTCYEFLAKGTKWKTLEDWVVNPSNVAGLDENYVLGNLGVDISKWEAAAGRDILGSGSMDYNTTISDLGSMDSRNAVYFANIADTNAIAVTYIWGIFGGAPSKRMLVEWDQVYDDVKFAWSSIGSLTAMDFESIATHELGHSVGMGDLYESGCGEQTMYGYASEGETKKRTLEPGDVLGISSLYR